MLFAGISIFLWLHVNCWAGFWAWTKYITTQKKYTPIPVGFYWLCIIRRSKQTTFPSLWGFYIAVILHCQLQEPRMSHEPKTKMILHVSLLLIFVHSSHAKCMDTYSLIFSFPLANLLAGKCNLAMSGRGALVFWSNPLTQTNPVDYNHGFSK